MMFAIKLMMLATTADALFGSCWPFRSPAPATKARSVRSVPHKTPERMPSVRPRCRRSRLSAQQAADEKARSDKLEKAVSDFKNSRKVSIPFRVKEAPVFQNEGGKIYSYTRLNEKWGRFVGLLYKRLMEWDDENDTSFAPEFLKNEILDEAREVSPTFLKFLHDARRLRDLDKATQANEVEEKRIRKLRLADQKKLRR